MKQKIVINGNVYLTTKHGDTSRKPMKYPVKSYEDAIMSFGKYRLATAKEIERHYPEDWEEHSAENLNDKTKAELLALADKAGTEIPNGSTKAEIIELLTNS